MVTGTPISLDAHVVDTGFALAVLNQQDQYHTSARKYYIGTDETMLLPSVTLTELAFHLHRLGKSRRVVDGMRTIQRGRLTIIDLLPEDYSRALDILEKYHDTRIDFVDSCLMALAERLQLKRILTFDHRDFGIFRPVHIERFELLP
jgi:uncharacterized protein